MIFSLSALQSGNVLPVVIAVSAVVFLIIVSVVTFLLERKIRHTWPSAIEKASARLAAIRTINLKYKFFDVKEETSHWRRLKSKQQIDNFNFSKNILRAVEDSLTYYKELIDETEENIKLKAKYDSELNFVPDFIDRDGAKKIRVPYRFCIKKEKAFCDKALLRPVVNPKIIYRVSYTSPAGRNHYTRTGVSQFKDIKQYVHNIDVSYRYKETKEYQRRAMNNKLRYEVLRRDNFRCQICGRSQEDGVKLHVDHIKPVSKGGKTEIDNLRTLCEECNLGKGADYDENGNN